MLGGWLVFSHVPDGWSLVGMALIAVCGAGRRLAHGAREPRRARAPRSLNRTMAQYFEVHPDNPQPRLLKQAVALLERGGVLAVPTDSSYALACHLDDKAAKQDDS